MKLSDRGRGAGLPSGGKTKKDALRAQRRIGELSLELEKAKPGPDSKKMLPGGGKKLKADALRAAGLSTSVAQRCEEIAVIPEREFEAALASEKPVTATAASASMRRWWSGGTAEIGGVRRRGIKPTLSG